MRTSVSPRPFSTTTEVGDLFSDHELSGVAKAVWIVALILFPLVTSIAYLVTRGQGMNERTSRKLAARQQQQDDYVRAVSGSGPATEIAQAKSLLDAGAITDSEFAALKTKILS